MGCTAGTKTRINIVDFLGNNATNLLRTKIISVSSWLNHLKNALRNFIRFYIVLVHIILANKYNLK